ncbi:MAG: uracil-DNA glycosylase [Verrucomicrobiota bacterium]|jgi:DNA polymerase|nr:uracil-DNA glycosylase [Verrucomicrobiota bacterium]
MKKSLSEQAVEYLEYLKEQGLTHVPASKKIRPKPTSVAAASKPQAPHRQASTPSPVEAASALPASSVPSAPPAGGVDTLESLKAEIAQCHACPLWETRLHTVPGQGILHPDIMFIGEGPGQNEDEQGLAFVGKAGQLLTKMIQAMGYAREDVFIANIVKCRPPGNRVPSPDEMAGCMPYLKRQIAIIQPKLIVCLGATAVRGLVQEQTSISRVRGSWREFEGIPVMLTFHPAYLLRDPRKKVEAWADLKAVLARLGKTPPTMPAKP